MAGFTEKSVDQVRAYWNARPCNIRHSPLPVGTREYFDQVEARKYLVEPHIPGFAEFHRWAGKRVLEIGCGIGTDTINFARAGAHVTVVELSDESLAVARRRADVFDLANRITFNQGNAEDLRTILPPQTFDLVYSFGVIHHTPRPERVFEAIRTFMHPDSTLKVMLYHRYAWKVLGILAIHGQGRFWKLDELIARHSEAQTGCPVTYSYSRAGIRDLLHRLDYRVERVWVDHIFPYRVRDYVQYRYVRQWPWRWMPAPLFRGLERLLGWHLLVEARGPLQDHHADAIASAPHERAAA